MEEEFGTCAVMMYVLLPVLKWKLCIPPWRMICGYHLTDEVEALHAGKGDMTDVLSRAPGG